MRPTRGEHIATHPRVPPEVHTAVATTASITATPSCTAPPNHRSHATESRRRMMRPERPAHPDQTPAETGWLLRRHALAPREPTPVHLVEAARIEAHRPHLPRRGETLRARREAVGYGLRRGYCGHVGDRAGRSGGSEVLEQANQPADYRPTLEKSSINSSRIRGLESRPWFQS